MAEPNTPQRQTELDVRKVQVDAAVLTEKVEAIRLSIEKLVTRLEFAPIKLIVYGLVASVLAGVIAGLLATILRGK